MSRIGFKPVTLPAGVSADIADGVATIKGPKGELTVKFPKTVSVSLADGIIHVLPVDEEHPDNVFHGTVAAHLHNAVYGVSEGWKKELEINGTGYRASMKGTTLTMFLGYSHQITVEPIGKYTKITCPDETHVVVEGCDKQQVGETAARIHDSRRPDPYGAKGVKYKGEHILRKVGKRAAAGGKK